MKRRKLRNAENSQFKENSSSTLLILFHLPLNTILNKMNNIHLYLNLSLGCGK